MIDKISASTFMGHEKVDEAESDRKFGGCSLAFL